MKKSKRKPYSYLETGDGSKSVYADEYGQAMHSLSGAYEESLYKHIIPSGVTTLQKDEISVLDVGFGLGYNVLALLYCCDNIERFKKISVVSLEREKSVGNLVSGVEFYDDRDTVYDKVRAAAASGAFHDDRISISIIFGDARHTLKAMKGIRFDGVFHDPFSPATNPELWTVEFFSRLCSLVEPYAVVTTYSAALQVRMAMMESGFIIGRGPSVGGKKEGTVATKNGSIDALSEDEVGAIRSVARAIPYRDISGCSTRDEILNRRIEEMRRFKTVQAKSNRQVHQ